MALPLWYFADKRMPFLEAEQFFRRAVTALQSVSAEKENTILCGLLLALQGWFASDTTSRALVGKSLLILRQYYCPEETVVALFIMGLIAGYGLRDFAEGEKVAREGAQIARDLDIQWALGHCLLHIGYCLRGQGDLEQARQVGQECLKISEPIGNLWIMAANALLVLGGVAMDRGDYLEAERQIEQSLQWYSEVEFGYPWAGALCCEYLAKVALLTHQYDKAKFWLQQSLSYFQKAGRGIDREAGEALCYVSRLFAAWGSMENAVEILSAISQIEHPPQDQYVGDLATASLAELQAALPAEIYAAAVERGKLVDLNLVITDFLAL